jgi:hypothetical protein
MAASANAAPNREPDERRLGIELVSIDTDTDTDTDDGWSERVAAELIERVSDERLEAWLQAVKDARLHP